MAEAASTWAAIFDQAADSYDREQLSFFDAHADAIVAGIGLRPGDRMLDVATGTGKVAVRAAAAVGGDGLVVGVDVSPSMLRRARAKATAAPIHYALMDARGLALRDRSFDVAGCAFGLTFMRPVLPEVIREMCRVVRPGGRIATATFTEDAFSPLLDVFLSALEDVGVPRSPRARPRWMMLDRERYVARLLRAGGLAQRRVIRATASTMLRRADDFWVLLQGSAWRSALRPLSPEATDRVREELERAFEDVRGARGVQLDTSALIGIGVRPSRAGSGRAEGSGVASERKA